LHLTKNAFAIAPPHSIIAYYGTQVEVKEWDADPKWANVQYQGQWGYALKEYMSTPKDENRPMTEAEQEQFSNPFTYSLNTDFSKPYVVAQVTLKEKLMGTASRNLSDLEDLINFYVSKGYRLHTMSTSESGSKGGLFGDRIQATLVFEKVGLFSDRK